MYLNSALCKSSVNEFNDWCTTYGIIARKRHVCHLWMPCVVGGPTARSPGCRTETSCLNNRLISLGKVWQCPPLGQIYFFFTFSLFCVSRSHRWSTPTCLVRGRARSFRSPALRPCQLLSVIGYFPSLYCIVGVLITRSCPCARTLMAWARLSEGKGWVGVDVFVGLRECVGWRVCFGDWARGL